MSIINKILVLTSVIALLLLTSCEKDPIDKIEPIEPIEVQTEEQSENPLVKGAGKMASDGFSIDCITFNYPFAFKLESGATVIVNNNDEAEIALYNEDDYVIDFVYPIEATDQDGNTFTINSADELAEAFVECIPEDGWDDFEDMGFPAFDFEGLCVNLAYPLTLQSDNESTIIVNNELEFADALINEFYYFSFPLTVIDLEGNTLIMDDDMALMDALFDCEGYYGNYYNTDCPFNFDFCFEIVYPVGLIDEVGNISNVDNADDFYNLLFSGKAVDFVYPITLISEDGTTEEIDDANAINELIDDCFSYDYGYYPPFYYHDFCFAINYPVDFKDASGNTQTANNEDELYSLMYSGEVTDFVYPITITLEDGMTEEVKDANAINELIDDCYSYGNYPPFYYYDFCFAINYPVDFKDASGNAQTANNEGELYELMYSGEVTDFVYPITVTLKDGTTTTVGDQNELNNIIAECPYEYEYDYNYEESAFGLLIGGELFCFDINYPIIIIVDDEEKTVNDESEFESLDLFSGYGTFPAIEIGYPLTVTSNTDNSTITFTKDTELKEYIDNCP